VKNRVQNLPFKCNLQRYSAAAKKAKEVLSANREATVVGL
jgi:molecular chaperone DnaK (HSP70)